MSAFHGQQTTADGVHILPRYTFTTQANMLAAAYTAADEGCCIQVGNAAPFTYYIMKDSGNSADLALGYVAIAAGTGDFVGPAGAIAGNVVSFGDATGLVGADSGRLAANIPSSMPIGFAEGGTGQTTSQTAMEALSPAPVGTLYVNGTYTGTSTGSVNAPFTTISDALTHIGPATTAAMELESWTILISPGFYDEDLSIPELRTISFLCEGLCILSDTALATTRSISLNCTSAPMAIFPKLIRFERVYMTGSFVLTSFAGGQEYEIKLEDCMWASPTFAGANIDATGWPQGPQLRFYLTRCRLNTNGTDMILSNTISPQADVGLAFAADCDFSSGNITMGGYGHIEGCRMGGSHDWKWTAGPISASNLEHPVGYVDCEWDNPNTHTITCDGPAGGFQVDSMSYRASQGINFAGAAAFTADPYRGLSNAYYPFGGQWNPAGNDKGVRDALERLATAVQGLLGSQIP